MSLYTVLARNNKWAYDRTLPQNLSEHLHKNRACHCAIHPVQCVPKSHAYYAICIVCIVASIPAVTGYYAEIQIILGTVYNQDWRAKH